MTAVVTERTVDPPYAYGRVPKVGYRGQLSGSSAVLYTAPTITGNPTAGSVSSFLRGAVVCNTDSSARTYTLRAVESGGTSNDARAQYDEVTIAAHTTHRHTFKDGEFPLAEGETINGLASVADVVTVRLSVEEITY